jgi:hypothetical protein
LGFDDITMIIPSRNLSDDSTFVPDYQIYADPQSITLLVASFIYQFSSGRVSNKTFSKTSPDTMYIDST